MPENQINSVVQTEIERNLLGGEPKYNRADIVEKYGERWFRLWSFFLAWSALIGSQGSSALFMLTLGKNLKNDRATVPSQYGVRLGRRARYIGPDPVATQP